MVVFRRRSFLIPKGWSWRCRRWWANALTMRSSTGWPKATRRCARPSVNCVRRAAWPVRQAMFISPRARSSRWILLPVPCSIRAIPLSLNAQPTSRRCRCSSWRRPTSWASIPTTTACWWNSSPSCWPPRVLKPFIWCRPSVIRAVKRWATIAAAVWLSWRSSMTWWLLKTIRTVKSALPMKYSVRCISMRWN